MPTSKSKALEKADTSAELVLNEQQSRTLKAAIAKSPAGRPPTDQEWDLFRFQAGTLNLNPFKAEIGMAKWSNAKDAPLVPYVTWMGHLKLADDQHKLIGVERYWCGPDGEWKEVWLGDAYPAAAKVVLWLEGLSRPVTGVAKWSSWVKMGHPDKLDPKGNPVWGNYEGRKYKEKDKTRLEPIGNWKTMPDHMLSVAAARLAAKLAARVTGQELDFDAAAETILFRDRQKRAFALARELDLDENARHELSEGESWSTVDYEMMCEIVARMEEMQRGLELEAKATAEDAEWAEMQEAQAAGRDWAAEKAREGVVSEPVEPKDANSSEAAGPGEALGEEPAADGEPDEEVVDGEVEEGDGSTLGGSDPDRGGRSGGPTSLSASLAEAAVGWGELDESGRLEDGEGTAGADSGTPPVGATQHADDPDLPLGDSGDAGAEVDLKQAALEATEQRAQIANSADPLDVMKRIAIRRIKTRYPAQYEKVNDSVPLIDLSLEELAQLEEELHEGALADGATQEKMV